MLVSVLYLNVEISYVNISYLQLSDTHIRSIFLYGISSRSAPIYPIPNVINKYLLEVLGSVIYLVKGPKTVILYTCIHVWKISRYSYPFYTFLRKKEDIYPLLIQRRTKSSEFFESNRVILCTGEPECYGWLPSPEEPKKLLIFISY